MTVRVETEALPPTTELVATPTSSVTVWSAVLAPPNCKEAVPARVTPAPAGRLLAPPSRMRRPALTVEAPVKEETPLRVRLPEPFLVTPPAPLLPMALVKVMLFPLVSKVAPPVPTVTVRPEISNVVLLAQRRPPPKKFSPPEGPRLVRALASMSP